MNYVLLDALHSRGSLREECLKCFSSGEMLG
jgi:hypothetical protein